VDPPALGRRGEGWVVLQLIVIVAAVACAVIGPSWPCDSESWLRFIGFVLEAVGAGILIVSRITLGRSFTAMPRPRDRSTLRTTGIYAGARHPFYGGLLILLLGLSFHRSPAKPAGAWLLEKVSRLKLNGQLRGYSPLSRLLELEGLEMGITGKRSLWQALGRAFADDERVAGFDFAALVARADEQLAGLRDRRLAAVREALVDRAASPTNR
jgi:hypothetical protein